MASYLQIENISKSYGPKILFENIGFNVNEGDKIALIAPNGTGKTSLLRILAGKDKSDSGGKITFLKDIRIAFLEQEYDFDPESDIFSQIMRSAKPFTDGLDEDHLFQYELRVRQLLTNFGMTDFSVPMKNLSGGEVKRVAICQMLATEAEFLIMDEPTNHLDIDAIEYLESYLSHSRCTLLMVTHDRYFLDRVCNIVMEMDRGALYTYRGDYENYIEKRAERISNYNAETDKVRNILRRELEWMRSTPCARSGKAKYRKDAFYVLKDRAEDRYVSKQVDLGAMGEGSRLGTKIINCKDLTFGYGSRTLVKGFDYNFQRYERVGIVGKNGAGKSTFLDLIDGIQDKSEDFFMRGSIDRGESLKIGYYHQGGMAFDENQTVLETVNDTHLLSMFLFPHDMLNTRVSKLSGGEKRRLYLLTILMQNPNLLILDEPTNDLDIMTLNVLEEYLSDYKGSLLVVTHDRHFLDRLASHLFIFKEDGTVKDYIGRYSEYRESAKMQPSSVKAPAVPTPAKPAKKTDSPRKLSFKEKREMEQLEKEIEELGNEKKELETAMNSGTMEFGKLQEASVRFGKLTEALDEKELRWLELSEIG